MPRLKVKKKKVKNQGQGHKVQNVGTSSKVLPEEIYMSNMKALLLMDQKLWPRLKFLKSWSKIKVKVTSSKILVPVESICLRKYLFQV